LKTNKPANTFDRLPDSLPLPPSLFRRTPFLERYRFGRVSVSQFTSVFFTASYEQALDRVLMLNFLTTLSCAINSLISGYDLPLTL